MNIGALIQQYLEEAAWEENQGQSSYASGSNDDYWDMPDLGWDSDESWDYDNSWDDGWNDDSWDWSESYDNSWSSGAWDSND